MIAITTDIDWAPEEVIIDLINILEKNSLKCTFFCTHKSEVLLQCNRDFFELAIHPNFNYLLEGAGGKAEKVVDDLLNIFPESRGVRSHSLLHSSALLNLFARKGLIYESNLFLPYQKNIILMKLWNGLIRLPFFWEDDLHWIYKKEFSDLGVDLSAEGLKIFNFHPIHVFLNTIDDKHYQNAREFYNQPDELSRRSNKGPIKGVRDALFSLIEQIKNLHLETYKLSEIKQRTSL